jgi:hypothetical protein
MKIGMLAITRPTQRAATVLNVKAVAVFLSGWKEKRLHAERLLVAYHRIQDREELSHTCSKSNFFQFASFQ